jgi:chromosome segregation protein
VRLHSIKLSGFKSFAEPTHLQLPGQLVGVVGPNGCGKSNIMDAVRWVLGESRASELRGESMQDVIFNGTTQRKAASRASVELLFDNADHRIGGQWGQFAEIAVRRTLTRDGTSSYFINNQAVRRRDVQDVFLGTGLGPRAYAIIGQGTISRIIESRPEELRLFLEEAAGVSKYKERRRETENRIADTRENLTRVEDILRELSANLSKLEKQAEAAVQFQSLQKDVTHKQQQQWFLKRAEAAAEQTRVLAEAAQSTNALESRTADLRQTEADLEQVRQTHYAAGDEVNQAQGALYEASTEVGRLEAEIRFVVDGRQRSAQRISSLGEQIRQWVQRREDAQTDSVQVGASLAGGENQVSALTAQLQALDAQLPVLEASLQTAQAAADTQRSAVAQVQQEIQVLAAEQRSMQEQERQLQGRSERLGADRHALAAPDDAQLQALAAQATQAAAANEAAQSQLLQAQEALPALDAERRSQQQRVNTESSALADVSARLGALKALQERVTTEGKLRPWLRKHGLDGLQALWIRLQVAPGWESALEAALRERLGALEVSRLDMVAAFAVDPPPTKLTFFTPDPAAANADAATGLPPLLAQVQSHHPAQGRVLADWLRGCYSAESFEEALAQRGRLGAGEAFYLRSGHVVTAHSVGLYAPDSEQAGLLARAQEITALERTVAAQTETLAEARRALAQAETRYAQASEALQRLRQQAAQAQSQSHALQMESLRAAQLAEQTRSRATQLDADLGEVRAQLDALAARRSQADSRFETLDEQLGQAQEAHATLDDQVLDAQRQLAQWRDQHRTLERQAQEAQFSQRSVQARLAELARAVQTAEQQSATLQQELDAAQAELLQLDDAAATAGLQDALALKLEREQALAAQRTRYDGLTATLRASDERRLKLEHELAPLRQRITDFQLKEQAARLGYEQFDGFLTDAKADLDELAASLAEGKVHLPGLQAEIERLQQAIAAMGAVNLAAPEELAVAGERKTFLDAQSADLQEAMATLEDAIRTIDGETRELLAATFEQVNGHFGRMFPELFGGGTAQLVMTGEEILDAGVQVVAQPPGKKNQTIHLLSGGEKALTAIALVFAIFQLNPAPFCLLDEVDAPLDDANTERYSKLVRSMSQSTQFLFISHNKIAMEMAEQLIGVTMQEQGVSRIVVVDMASAVQLAGVA